MDDSSSKSPLIPTGGRKRSEEGNYETLPEKRPCMETPPEDMLYPDEEFSEELPSCFYFEETLVSDLMKELEEEIKGPILPATTRVEEMCGPSISRTESSVMASVHVVTTAIFFPDVSFPFVPFLDASKSTDPPEMLTEDSGEEGEGRTAGMQVGEEVDDEEWLRLVLSVAPIDTEQGLGFWLSCCVEDKQGKSSRLHFCLFSTVW